jgi:hypothetical protein
MFRVHLCAEESGANSTDIFLRKFQSATSRYLFSLPRCCGVWPHGKIKSYSVLPWISTCKDVSWKSNSSSKKELIDEKNSFLYGVRKKDPRNVNLSKRKKKFLFQKSEIIPESDQKKFGTLKSEF